MPTETRRQDIIFGEIIGGVRPARGGRVRCVPSCGWGKGERQRKCHHEAPCEQKGGHSAACRPTRASARHPRAVRHGGVLRARGAGSGIAPEVQMRTSARWCGRGSSAETACGAQCAIEGQRARACAQAARRHGRIVWRRYASRCHDSCRKGQVMDPSRLCHTVPSHACLRSRLVVRCACVAGRYHAAQCTRF